MEPSVLDLHQQQYPHLVELIDSMRVYSSEKFYFSSNRVRLWKQLSDALLQYIKDPQISSGTNLKDLYEGFMGKYYHEIDEYKLVRFLIKASDQYGAGAIDFLSKFHFTESQAKLMIQLKQANYLLQENKVEEVGNLLNKYKKEIERIQDVEPLLYSLLYHLAFSFYRVKRSYEDFYINALQYLAYTPEEVLLSSLTLQQEMQQEEKINLSLEMALAVLVSPEIYNYSELLSQKVLVSLKNSPHAWVYTMLETFNKGDVSLFQQQVQQFNSQIQAQSQLAQNLATLHEKIRIMAFLELAFQLPKNNRTCSFQAVSQVTYLDNDLIEALVMRTISKGLVKGTINQINQTVTLSYIVPRVLSLDKIEIMLSKFNDWERTLKVLLSNVDRTQEQLK